MNGVFLTKVLMAALPDADLPPIAAAVANLLYAPPKRVLQIKLQYYK